MQTNDLSLIKLLEKELVDHLTELKQMIGV